MLPPAGRAICAVVLISIGLQASGCNRLVDFVNEHEDQLRQTYRGIGVAEVGNTYLIAHEDGDWMAVDVDPTTDMVTRSIYVTPDGDEILIDVDETGFPSSMFVDGLFVLFERVDETHTDIALVDSIGRIKLARDLAITDTLVIAGLGKGESFQRIDGDVATAVKAAGLVTGIATCSYAAGWWTAAFVSTVAIPLEPVILTKAIIATTGCLSTLVATAQTISPAARDALGNTGQGFQNLGLASSAIGCSGLAGPGGGADCIGAGLTAAAEVLSSSEEKKAQNQSSLAEARARLENPNSFPRFEISNPRVGDSVPCGSDSLFPRWLVHVKFDGLDRAFDPANQLVAVYTINPDYTGRPGLHESPAFTDPFNTDYFGYNNTYQFGAGNCVCFAPNFGCPPEYQVNFWLRDDRSGQESSSLSVSLSRPNG